MNDEKIEFSVGSVMHLQPTLPENSLRFPVSVLGYQTDRSLIVTTPMIKGKVQIVREGLAYYVRMLFGDSVKAFTTKVLVSAVKPYPHLHLEFPQEFESINVRNSSRVTISLPAMVTNTAVADSGEMPAELCDMSSSGAAILMGGRPYAQVGDTLKIAFELNLLGSKEIMDMSVIVRRVIQHKPQNGLSRYFYGLEFANVNRYQQLVVHGWVLEQNSV